MEGVATVFTLALLAHALYCRGVCAKVGMLSGVVCVVLTQSCNTMH